MGGSCRLSKQIRIVDQDALGDASCTTQDPLRRTVSHARQPATGEDRQHYPELMEERAHTSVYPGVDYPWGRSGMNAESFTFGQQPLQVRWLGGRADGSPGRCEGGDPLPGVGAP